MKNLISICQKTSRHFKTLLNNSNDTYIFIGVKGGGCNGLKYYINTTSEKPMKLDEVINDRGVPIILCGNSIMYLLGSSFYWKTDNMGSSIDIKNPNATTSCGCGDTFSVK